MTTPTSEKREAARLVGLYVEDALRGQDFTKVNDMLKSADFAILSVREATMLIRASARAKARLPYWLPALRRFAAFLKQSQPDRYAALMVGLEEFVPAYCVMIDARLKSTSCPLEKGKCYWQNRNTNECCYTECELSPAQFVDLTGADPVAESDVEEFKARLRTHM